MSVSKSPTSRRGKQQFADGVVLYGNAPHTTRWQEYGNDRIYLESTKDDGGYVDLANGEVVDLDPHYGSGVDRYEMRFNAESGNMELYEIPREEIARKNNAEERLAAEIPREVML